MRVAHVFLGLPTFRVSREIGITTPLLQLFRILASSPVIVIKFERVQISINCTLIDELLLGASGKEVASFRVG